MMRLQQEFQKKLEVVERQMQDLGEQIAPVQTYQALVKESSPLATKTEQEILRQDVNLIKIQLNTLISLVQNQNHQPPIHQESIQILSTLTHTPPKGSTTLPKRTRVETSPVRRMTSLEDVYTQEPLESSAASIPEEDMEGCDD